MKRLCPILLSILGSLIQLAGCASHYVTVEGEMLSVYLDRPEARQVVFACSLDDFTPHEAHKEAGLWVVSFPCGDAFRYFYVLDGDPFLPACRLQENDDFGAKNCIYDPNL